MDALTKAISAAGGVVALSKAIGVTQGTVSNWRMREVRAIPADHCASIELATVGAVKRWDLRPDDWHRIWPELIGQDGAPAVPEATRAQG
jgi:DNA-binding transcriptional regulator YdaS (Cro superfamily)